LDTEVLELLRVEVLLLLGLAEVADSKVQVVGDMAGRMTVSPVLD